MYFYQNNSTGNMKIRLKPILLALIIIFAIYLLFFERNAATSWLLKLTGKESSFIGSSSRGLKNFLSFIPKISSLNKENIEMKKKIISLEVDKSRILELEKENSLLKEEIGFIKSNPEIKLIPAKIIQRDPVTFLDYVIVDKGSGDGVNQGRAVIFSGALVGKVSQVFENQSKITLITSKDSYIQAMLQENRAKGVLKGGISGLFLDDVIIDSDPLGDENVITSGLGGAIRQGILIGKTKKDVSSLSGVFKMISVDPVVDLSKLDIIFIEQ